MMYYVTGISLFVAFAVLTILVLHSDSLVAWDRTGFAAVNNPDGKLVNQMMISLTKYGREAVWIATTALLFVFGGRDGRRTSALLVVAFLILIPLGTVLKDEIGRQRPVPANPENLLVRADNDSSFPSGHAVIVSAGAFIMLARFNHGRQAIVSLALLVEAFLVIYSRIYVGNHYPLDVVAGTFVGTGTGAIVIGFSRYLNPIFVRLDSLRKK